MSDDDQVQLQSHIKHRRKKNEIEKEFICGDASCGRKYGTNAALYTHIKNKHNGVAPVGTVKPSTSKKAKESSPERQNTDDEQSKTVETLSDPDFMKFSLMISDLGQIDERNLIVRDEEDEYNQLTEQTLTELYQNIMEASKQLQMNMSHRIFTKKAEQYLRFSSPFWKKQIITELYSLLMYSYVLRGEKFEIIHQDIIKKCSSYKLLSEIVNADKLEQLKEVYTTIWNFIN